MHAPDMHQKRKVPRIVINQLKTQETQEEISLKTLSSISGDGEQLELADSLSTSDLRGILNELKEQRE